MQKDEVRAKEVGEIYARLQNVMCYLSGRWNDEKEYEDIEDYKARIETELSDLKVEGFKIAAMKKRPFGFKAEYKGATYVFTMGARAYEYKRTS
jgi:hypothetical protein